MCQACGFESPRWLGKCPECQKWNTFAEEPIQIKAESVNMMRVSTRSPPLPLTEISLSEERRIATGIGEFDRVLGVTVHHRP